MRSAFLRGCLLTAIALPLIAMTARKSLAGTTELGCSCNGFCHTGTGNCTILICSDGTSQQCYGTKIQP